MAFMVPERPAANGLFEVLIHALVPVALVAGVALGPLTGCSSQGDAATDESYLGTCPSGHHECDGWGTSCDGSKLLTCVVGPDGCHKLLEQTCSSGCTEGTCKTCDAVPSPLESKAASASPAAYRATVRKGEVAFAAWNGRDGQYQTAARGIATIDLSNPTALGTLATTALPDNTWVRALEVAGDRLLVLEAAQLDVFDASSPANLVPVSTYTPATEPTALGASGTLAFVASSVGLDVVDVSGPTAQLVGSVSTTLHPTGVAAFGNLVAVAGDYAVEIVNVTNPALPVLLAKTELGAHVSNYSSRPVAFDGVNVFVLATPPGDHSQSGLYVAALSETGTPTLSVVGKVPRLGAHTLWLDGSRVALGIGSAVASVDVSKASAPKLVEHVTLPGRQQAVVASGSTIFASGIDGVTAVDLDRSPDVTLVPTKTFGQAVVRGALAYLARDDGFVIEDIRDPVHPSVLSSTPMVVEGVAVDGHYAYVTVLDEGLRVYDVRSPWEPALVSSASVAHEAYSANPMFFSNLSLSNGRAYAHCGISSICVFDVSDPTNATLLVKSDAALKWLGGMSAFTPLAIRDGLVYLPDAAEMRILDMTNPTSPQHRGTVALGGYETGETVSISLAGPYAYVGYSCHYVYGDTCIDVVDVANPDAPMKLSSTVLGAELDLNERRRMAWLRAYGKQLVLAYPAGGFDLLDLTDPVHPNELGDLYSPRLLRIPFVTDRFLVGSTQDGSESVAQVIELCR